MSIRDTLQCCLVKTVTVAILAFVVASLAPAQASQPRPGCDSAVMQSGSTVVEDALPASGENHHSRPVVAFEIQQDGSVRKVRLVRHSGVKALDERLLSMASQWKYQDRPGCGIMKVPLAAGSIPDAATAVMVAEPELIRVYGSKVDAERPINAALSGDIWIVGGTLHCSDGRGGTTTHCVGGVATAHVTSVDGRVVRIFHTK